jgi:hypothetical protein
MDYDIRKLKNINQCNKGYKLNRKYNKDTQHTDSTVLQNNENYGVYKRMLKLK